MLTRYIGLVTEDSTVTMSELTKVAAALQKQATRDFGPLWKIEASINAFHKLEDLPLDYWPIIIKDDIGAPDAAGYHDDNQGQPYSLVQFDEGWHLTASHEMLEMLGDPYGRRLIAGDSPVKTQGRVKFLVEVCDPSEDEAFGYKINGIQMSDFYTPHYFEPVKASGVRYSYTGAITEPRQVLKGGYLSWYVPSTKAWWQRTWFGAKASDKQLFSLNAQNGNLRAAIDRLTTAERAKAAGKDKKNMMMMGKPKPPVETDESFAARAADIRASIAAVSKP